VIYQDPLAYLVGIEGAALMHAYNGDYDREFTEARLAEVRAMLDSAAEFGEARATRPITTAEGYDIWAENYDDPGDLLIETEQPLVREILAQLPPGIALDAACGTGRHAEYLASLGHQVIGVDGSAEMLAVARGKIPGGEFRQGDLSQLPVPDRHVDLVVCALALMHVRDLGPVLAEFVRVLRPGGHLVISDARNEWPVVRALPDGDFGYLPHRRHITSEYLTEALPLGLRVLHCEEPCLPDPAIDPSVSPPTSPVRHPAAIRSLQQWCPDAANAFYRGRPIAIIWHFQLDPPQPASLPRADGPASTSRSLCGDVR
jgi:ubiquinone/menaquinone biosynthesis C-methylase UbiE